MFVCFADSEVFGGFRALCIELDRIRQNSQVSNANIHSDSCGKLEDSLLQTVLGPNFDIVMRGVKRSVAQVSAGSFINENQLPLNLFPFWAFLSTPMAAWVGAPSPKGPLWRSSCRTARSPTEPASRRGRHIVRNTIRFWHFSGEWFFEIKVIFV